MIRSKVYPSGLRLLVLPTDVRSVTLGVWVRAGSAYETAENNGISHFVEHMLFKGTSRRSAFDISKEMDDIGAQLNAFTSREYTCYYTKSVDSDAPKCFDLLADMLYRSKFPHDELEREQQVVLEEIAMVEDSPEDVCHELLTSAVYGSDTYGRTVLGTAENVSSFTKQTIRSYMDARYVSSDVVLSVVGNIDTEYADELVRKYFDTSSAPVTAPDAVRSVRRAGTELAKRKQIEQASIALAFPAYPYDDDKTFAAQIASMAIGGGMSSRLFQEVREKKGLAYSVYSFLTSNLYDGTFAVYCGTNPKKSRDALATMADVLSDARDKGLTEEEFLRGKAQVRGGFILGQENSYTLMNTVGKYMIQTGKVYDIEENLALLERVTLEDCNAVLKESLDFERACLAVVSDREETGLLQSIR